MLSSQCCLSWNLSRVLASCVMQLCPILWRGRMTVADKYKSLVSQTRPRQNIYYYLSERRYRNNFCLLNYDSYIQTDYRPSWACFGDLREIDQWNAAIDLKRFSDDDWLSQRQHSRHVPPDHLSLHCSNNIQKYIYEAPTYLLLELQPDMNSQNHIPRDILPSWKHLPLVGNIIRVALAPPPNMLAKARNGS